MLEGSEFQKRGARTANLDPPSLYLLEVGLTRRLRWDNLRFRAGVYLWMKVDTNSGQGPCRDLKMKQPILKTLRVLLVASAASSLEE